MIHCDECNKELEDRHVFCSDKCRMRFVRNANNPVLKTNEIDKDVRIANDSVRKENEIDTDSVKEEEVEDITYSTEEDNEFL
jgi:hypothetical protein